MGLKRSLQSYWGDMIGRRHWVGGTPSGSRVGKTVPAPLGQSACRPNGHVTPGGILTGPGVKPSSSSACQWE